jgi:predicted NBD/HSP70 family sugar kinase
VAGTVVGVPGLVGGDGLVRSAPNLGWRDVDVAGALDPQGKGPAVRVDNEANLAALAELHAHPASSASPLAGSPGMAPSFVYVSGEIGVGAGIVLDGRLLRGARGYGGEIGHVTINPDGPRCRCGSHGCLETYTNQELLLSSAELPPSTTDDPLVRLVQQADSGSAPVLAALERAGTALGIAAADVVNLVDVDTVVLGGIYAQLAPWLAGPVTREITARTVTSAWAPVTVRPAAVGTMATVVGGAGSVVRQILDAPATWLARTAS